MTFASPTVDVDSRRIQEELEALASWSEAEPPAVTRVVFTDMDLQARAFVKRLCDEAGLSVREDAIGNTFALWEGRRPDLPAIATGSHIDAIPGAGRFDGTVGVLGGIAQPATLTALQAQLRRTEIESEASMAGLSCPRSAGRFSPHQF